MNSARNRDSSGSQAVPPNGADDSGDPIGACRVYLHFAFHPCAPRGWNSPQERRTAPKGRPQEKCIDWLASQRPPWAKPISSLPAHDLDPAIALCAVVGELGLAYVVLAVVVE